MKKHYTAMKKRNRKVNLILIIVCAIFLCCSFILLLNADKKEVFAETNTPTINIESSCGYEGSSSPITSGPVSALNATLPTNHGSMGSTENSITFQRTSTTNWVGGYVLFTTVCVVPAHTAYDVTYTFTLSFKRTSLRDNPNAAAKCELFYYGSSDLTTSVDFNYAGTAIDTNSNKYTVQNVYCENSATGTSVTKSGSYTTDTFTYDNNTDADKTYKAYFGILFVATAQSSTGEYDGAMNLSSRVTPLNKVSVPTLNNANLLPSSTDVSKYYETNYSATNKSLPFVNFNTLALKVNIATDNNGLTYSGGALIYTNASPNSSQITLSLEDNYCWDDGSCQQIFIFLDINKADPVVVFDDVNYCTQLPDSVPVNADDSTAGSAVWTANATTQNAEWQFTPTDTVNYNTIIGVVPAEKLVYGHIFENYVSDGNATCTEDGTKTAICSICGTEKQTVTDEGSALGHEFNNYVSNGDATCAADGTETSTCSHDGCDATDTRTEVGSRTENHTYTSAPVWSWGEMNATAKATFTCDVCGETIDVTATIKQETASATCTVAGDTVYTATVEFNGQEYSDEQIISGQTLPHDYSITQWHWAEDYSSAYAEYECTVCGESGITTENQAVITETDATCESAGAKIYTVTVELPYGVTQTDEKREETQPLGHEFTGAPVEWIWSDDYSTAYAVFECARCSDGRQEVTATVVEESEQPTCVASGKSVFTATVEMNGETYVDEQLVEYPPIAHNYEITEWVWEEDYSSAHAIYACTVCGDTASTEQVDSVVTRTEPTATEDGLITYTVTVTYPDSNTATDEKTVVIPATGEIPEDTEGTGCTAKINPLLWVCIGLFVWDILMFVLTLRVILKNDGDDDDDDENGNTDVGTPGIIVIK